MASTDFLTRHADAVRAGDLDAVAALYADGARLVTLTGTHDGGDAVRQRYQAFFAFHGAIASLEVAHQQQTGTEALAAYAIESERGRFTILNAFVLDGDACRLHFSNETDVTLDADEVTG